MLSAAVDDHAINALPTVVPSGIDTSQQNDYNYGHRARCQLQGLGMPPQSAYNIIYAPIVKEHLREIDRKYYTLIRTIIQERLAYEPTAENRNRKPLKRPAFGTATWELRFGPENMFRVFYELQSAAREVHILAIGVKVRDTIFIGGEAIKL